MMHMTAYESVLASQQWTQHRARLQESRHNALQIPTHRVLTAFGLMVMCYFTTCGGPVGTEPLISSGGPLRGIIAQIIYPVFFNFPILLAITELATAYPNDGGYSVWVLNAFGPFWGFQAGFWSWVASIMDRIVYVQFMYEKILTALGYDSETLFSYGAAYVIKASVVVLLSIPALFGAQNLVRVLIGLLVLVLAPFSIMSIWGFSKTESAAAFGEVRPDSNIGDDWLFDWSGYADLFWLYDGFYLAAVFGGEVARPAATYPQGIKFGFLLTWFSYFLPMIAAVGAASTLHWSQFEEDSYPDIARAFGGTTLYAIVMVGLVAGVVGMYMAELFCQAYQMRGMAENGLLPSLFMERDHTFGTPRKSIYFTTCIVLLGLFVVDEVYDCYEVRNALSGLVELFIIVAALWLRHTQPFVYRSIKVPGGLAGMVALLILPAIMLCYHIIYRLVDSSCTAVLVGILLAGFLYSGATWMWHQRQQKKQLPDALDSVFVYAS
uniref:Amino acid permease/ SLC12A domain-containing protein n=1 Tax=Globisporangium ultimum (strain ATCC 200006 / CBS 805.95 / DAOM BR144) TaxID=431595 RepID=K3WXF3_GLOUD